ncbi:transport protein Sec23 [Dermatophagoides pteronyssinus]|uniref:Protein transport protein Sec23A n=2 Tax=Dermatophagoides pteronyssinus TaxID=6956 RepID=A0ABQ8JPV7_DERPT|nr:protein transport protein Sec23A-like [Dermatophagoides pteronyssinus]KAH9424455.1 Protein transport protein Sec23A [Dermatophagoides pteronyssinus]
MEEYIESMEDRDGIRFNWNRWPQTRVEAAKVVLPLGCLFTPLKETQRDSAAAPSSLQYEPVVCARPNCRSILNPYCQVDYRAKIWVCPFCLNRNSFPNHYHQITETYKPAELGHSTVDYVILRAPISTPPIFVYVIDTCIDEEELNALKSSILSSLKLLPPNSLACLITFGRIVSLWEINTNLRSFVFKGSKDYTAKQLQEWLGIRNAVQQTPQPMQQHPNSPINVNKTNMAHKFLQPISQADFILNDIINQITRDSWPTPQAKRPLRATGAALSIAISLLEITYPNCGARIMMFIGGPCTTGPGMIIDDDLKNTIRSHHDIEKDNCKYMKKAMKHYQALAQRAAVNGHTIDIYSCALDQTGLHEMKYCVNSTGGLMIMCDSFDSNLFKLSLSRVFAKDKEDRLKMAFNAVVEIKTSRELKVSGCIGSCVSMNVRNQYVSDTEIGIGNTAQWKFCSLTSSSTTSFYFDIVQTQATNQQQYGFIQFVTQYQGIDGYRHVRVTTVGREFSNTDFAFDQESACVLLARLACHRAQTEANGPDVLRWLDRNLIRLCQRFGEYNKESPESFRLGPLFSMFPQFIFHLRRSQFIQVFNNSPDETSFYRHSLFREDTYNSLVMIQPTLLAYSFNEPTQPVMLDTSSIHPERILMMDTFFQIVIFHGETIAAWRNAKYHEQSGYEAFAQLLAAPVKDAQDLMLNRFPLPRYIVCDQGSSQARFLLSKVNPSLTHNSAAGFYGDRAQAPVLTDDVSFELFMEHLKKLVVSSASN